MRLKDRVAIVTGAARGIGRAIAVALAREGARVAALDLDLVQLDDLVGQVRTRGGEMLALSVDVTRKEQIQEAVGQVLARWGRIDILVNNAGIYEVLPIEAISEEQWDRVLAVNLKGANLSGSVLSRAILTDSNLCEADFTDAALDGANLSNSDIINADFTLADLSMSLIRSCNLTRANLFKANLSGATLKMRGCMLGGLICKSQTWTKL